MYMHTTLACEFSGDESDTESLEWGDVSTFPINFGKYKTQNLVLEDVIKSSKYRHWLRSVMVWYKRSM